MYWLPYSSHTSHHPSQTPCLPWISYAISKTHARFIQDAPKAVWSIPYVSVPLFPSLKQNFIAYRSCKVFSRPGCIFEIHQLWQSGFSRVYSISCCSSSLEPEIIKIGQSSHKMYSNDILNSQGSTAILNAHTKKKVGNLLYSPRKCGMKTKPDTVVMIFDSSEKHFHDIYYQHLNLHSITF